ncbi:hypothetical protein FOZ63_009420 [Perkinsus olseni]|uniref:Reverse transcriptase domain-containing protein n=1 Tax=Perkinsus olseni TaxID=32597 RepID=A0A7J6NS11_PEROL|nr:hypothetical protein FOZ63_009420 [Perkinsus olseni]
MSEEAANRWLRSKANTPSEVDPEAAADHFLGTARDLTGAAQGVRRDSSVRAVSLSTDELLEVVRSLPRGRCPGDDETAFEHVQRATEASRAFLEEMRVVYEAMLRLGIFPEVFKPSKIILLGKPGRTPEGPGMAAKLRCVRPITLLRSLSKTAEKVILQRLRDKVANLPQEIHGFRPGRSPVTAVREVQLFVESKVSGPLGGANGTASRQGVACLLLEDISSAFDRCEWRHLVEAVKVNFGEEWAPLFESFLQGRGVRLVTAEGGKAYRVRTRGTPQGSSASPILFAAHTGDLAARIDRMEGILPEGCTAKLVIYADDIALALKARSVSDLAEAILMMRTVIKNWAENRGLTLAPEKEELLFLGSAGEKEELKGKVEELQSVRPGPKSGIDLPQKSIPPPPRSERALGKSCHP